MTERLVTAEQLHADLAARAAELRDVGRRWVFEFAKHVFDQARSNAPKRSGRLERSIGFSAGRRLLFATGDGPAQQPSLTAFQSAAITSGANRPRKSGTFGMGYASLVEKKLRFFQRSTDDRNAAQRILTEQMGEILGTSVEANA